MLRFVALALPLAVLLLTLGAFCLATLDLAPDLGPLDVRGVGRPGGADSRAEMVSRILEGAGIVALTLLLAGRTSRWYLDGLACGLTAWLFRGPLMVLAVAALTRLPTAPFATLARGALALDLAAALAVALLARATLPRDTALSSAAPFPE